MTQVATRDDPLRARSYQFWRKEFLPLLQRDCLRQAVIYATASALEAIKWGCPGGIATLFDTGVFSVYCLDDNAALNTPAYRQVEDQAAPPSTAHILIDGQLNQYEQQLNDLWSREDAPFRHIHLWIGLPEAMQRPPASPASSASVIDTNDSIINNTHDVSVSDTSKEEQSAATASASVYGLDRWRTLMTHWCKSITVEVHYAPALLWACIGKHFYVAPSCTHVFPALDVIIEDEMAPVSNHFTETQREGLRSLGALLSVVLAELRYKGEFFVIGESSKYVARQCHRLGAYATNKTSNDIVGGLDDMLHRETDAAVIIIDRTLDLVGPSSHQDNLMDQIYRVLQRRSVRDGSLDLKISSENVAASMEPRPSSSATNSATSVPTKLCSIAHGLNEECFDLIDSMIMTGQKDGLALVRKCLSDVILFEDPQAKIPRSMGRVTPALLNKLLSVFQDKRDEKLRHADLVELTAAVIQTLQESPKMMWDELASLEKTLSLSIGAVPKVNDMAVNATRIQKAYSLVDAMLLALNVYSMSGDTWKLPEEMELVLIDRWFAALLAGQRSLIAHSGIHGAEDQLLQSIGVLNKSDGEINTETDEQLRERRARVGQWLERVTKRLHEVAGARQHLTELRHLLRNESLIPYTPFVQQLFEDIYTAEPSDTNDLEHIPSGGTLGSYLTGFSRFLSNTKPHPRNYQHIILCVVGGITFNEVRLLRELTMTESTQASYSSLSILSTDIATGHTLFRHVLVDDASQ
ncbi:hypothetical protein BDF22DRAFT_776912 [Syncephalis plumigaleata]|nr:hypothetical protein BDF22DRAFT_776912 [Syncephalis plumigaleata]